jgi:hypothetical protein
MSRAAIQRCYRSYQTAEGGLEAKVGSRKMLLDLLEASNDDRKTWIVSINEEGGGADDGFGDGMMLCPPVSRSALLLKSELCCFLVQIAVDKTKNNRYGVHQYARATTVLTTQGRRN